MIYFNFKKGMGRLVDKLGIDAGGTFFKIAYEENQRLHTKSFLTKKMKDAITWINLLAPNAKKNVTGGKAGEIQSLLSGATSISEFDATSKGTSFLLNKEHNKTIERYLIVSVGTGTSILLIEDNQPSRLLGTGLGGGTFLGLGGIISGENDYDKLIDMANAGDRLSIDLVVSDIYTQGLSAIGNDLTAANFGKVTTKINYNKQDAMAALVNMIAETLCLLVSNAATQHQIQNVVYVGGALARNTPLKQAIHKYQKMLGLETLFLTSGQYAGAIGALYF
ncbi:type II pantothenate kinase [Heyndrickxia sp. NPDC080065]|uniref:type II pantothenate kinase n=1 Tax=Heyndrickxia sp. NPDC080065 TaxID=3390568 RepID=UPI003D0463C6